MLVGIDIHASFLHLVERRRVVHSNTQFAFLLPPHLLQRSELFTELITDGHILVVAKLDEVAFRLTHLLHELRYLHPFTFTNLNITGDVKPARHGRDGEMHIFRGQFTTAHAEAGTFRPFHDSSIWMFTKGAEKFQTLFYRQRPAIAVLLIFIRHKQYQSFLEVLTLRLQVTVCLQALTLINGRDEIHTLTRLHIRRAFSERTDKQLKNDLLIARLQTEDDTAVGIHVLDIRVLQQIAHHNDIA